jgi:hypothetical protein
MADETTYGNAYMALNEYMNAGIYARNAMSEWLPYSEVDVNERVYVELGEHEFDRDDNTMPLDDLIAELRDIAAKAPKGAEVVVELGTTGYDDSYNATYEVGYWRDPKKERAEREETNRKIRQRAEQRAAKAAEKERAEFERLKAKFASDSDPQDGDAT